MAVIIAVHYFTQNAEMVIIRLDATFVILVKVLQLQDVLRVVLLFTVQIAKEKELAMMIWPIVWGVVALKRVFVISDKEETVGINNLTHTAN